MFRLLFLMAFLSWPVTSSTDAGARDPLTRTHDAAFSDAERLSPLVEKRFALYGAMTPCHHADDQYAFNLALDKFAPSERYILRKAAYAGWTEGAERVLPDDATCAAAVDRLRAADDAIITQAELLPSR